MSHLWSFGKSSPSHAFLLVHFSAGSVQKASVSGNPSGKKAYIMNMYTNPAYRRKGIAIKTLDMLVQDAKKRGITQISLEATDMGRLLYEKYGFVPMNAEMELI